MPENADAVTSDRLAPRSQPFPRGTRAVALGQVTHGVTTYGFLILARRHLGTADYSTFSVLWSLVFIFTSGLFQPLEQEVARLTATRMAHHEPAGAVLRAGARIGMVFVAAIAILAASAWPIGLDGLLDQQWALLVALIASLVGFGASELARGHLGGRRDFLGYATYLATEGSSRAVLGVGLVLVGGVGLWGWGAALAAGFFVATVAVVLRVDRTPGPPVAERDLMAGLGVLLVMSSAEAFLLNVGPPIVEAGGDAAAGPFLNALVVARVPLFLFFAVKVTLLPSLSRHVSLGETHALEHLLRRVSAAIGAIAVVATAGSAVAGPWVVQLLFGDDVDRGLMALLAAGNCTSMLVATLAIGLFTMHERRLAAWTWLSAVATFLALLGLPLAAPERVAAALLGATVVGGVVGWVLVERALERLVPNAEGASLSG